MSCIYLRGILRGGSELGEVGGWDRQDVVGVVQQVGNHIGVATLSSFYQHGWTILQSENTDDVLLVHKYMDEHKCSNYSYLDPECVCFTLSLCVGSAPCASSSSTTARCPPAQARDTTVWSLLAVALFTLAPGQEKNTTWTHCVLWVSLSCALLSCWSSFEDEATFSRILEIKKKEKKKSFDLSELYNYFIYLC